MLYTLLEFKGVVSIFYQPHRAWLTLQCYTYHTEVQRNKNSKFYRSNTLAILWLPDYTELSCNSLEWKTLVFSELTSSVLGYRDVSSPWCSIAVWRDSLSFYCFCEVIILISQCHKSFIFTYTGHLQAEPKNVSIKFITDIQHSNMEHWTEFKEKLICSWNILCLCSFTEPVLQSKGES